MSQLAGLAQGEGGGFTQLLVPIALIMVFYFLMIARPKKREEEERRRRIESAQKGDRVMTIGGIHGKVAEVDAQRKTITIEVAPKVQIKFSLSAIATVESKNAPEPGDNAGENEQAKG